jgi:phosphatidylglycerophosphatase C
MNEFESPSVGPPAAPRAIALFDLDGTLTRRDTLLPFLTGYLARHPARILRLWRLPAALLTYALAGRDRGRLKSRAIRAVMGGDAHPLIEAWAERFVTGLTAKGAFHAAGLATLEAHRSAGDALVLLSASPDLYVPLIGKLLRFDRTVCTEIRWDGERLNGALRTPNRRGQEKVRCLARLREEYPHAPVTAYGNSASDLPHLKRAERALLVNGNRAARRQAAQAGIPTGDWN